MAKRKQASGADRQRQIQREQHRPEQNRGHDEAVRSEREGVAHDRPDRMVPLAGEETQLQNTTEDVDDREARPAQDEVRRREGTASRSDHRES
jgi:hypothetical protein